MHLDAVTEVVTDAATLMQRYRLYDGFIFTAIRNPANVYDAILIRNPSSARRFCDVEPESSHSLQEHIDFINKYEIEKAIVIADDISFLSKCSTLKHLTVIPSTTAGDNFDFSPLYGLSCILSLSCATEYGKFDENTSKIDYSKVCGLESVGVGSKNDLNYQCIPTLKSLGVSEYDGSDLNGLFCSKVLDTLTLTSCKIRTLDGIETAPLMQCLYLAYNRRLEDISKLEKCRKTLRALRIKNCPRISDFSVLSQLENLEHLILEGKNKLPSLSFIKELPNLKTLIFDMEIEDGDLQPCMDLPYVYCCRVRRHYNLKEKDLPKGTYYWGNDNIEPWRRVR